MTLPWRRWPLTALAPAVAARAETWERLGIAWRTRPISPNHGKPATSCEFESAAWLAEIVIWSTGEAELATVRLSDDRMVNKHYELTHQDDLDVLLDEWVALLARDRIPEAAVVHNGQADGQGPRI